MKHISIIFLLIISAITLSGCAKLVNSLSQEQTYNFHGTRWGMSQAQVEYSEIEQDSIIALRTPETLVYKCRLGDVQALRIYTFKNNRLRCAGYITKYPVKGKIDNRFHQLSIEKHGTPTFRKNNGDVWIHGNTVIYAKSYTSHIRAVVRANQLKSKYIMYTLGGMSAVLDSGLPTQRSTHPNIINRWSSVWSYTDRNFYSEMQEVEFPLNDLSISEQVLFGIIEKRYILELVPVF